MDHLNGFQSIDLILFLKVWIFEQETKKPVMQKVQKKKPGMKMEQLFLIGFLAIDSLHK